MRLLLALLLTTLPLAGCLGNPDPAPPAALDGELGTTPTGPEIDGYYARMGLELMTRGVGGAWYRSAGKALPAGDDVQGWVVEVHWAPGSAYWDQIRLAITPAGAQTGPGEAPAALAEATGPSPLRLTLPASDAGGQRLDWRISEVPGPAGAPLYQDFHVTVATFRGVAFDAAVVVPTGPVDEPSHDA